MRVHGAWLEMRSTSANSGAPVALGELEALEAPATCTGRASAAGRSPGRGSRGCGGRRSRRSGRSSSPAATPGGSRASTPTARHPARLNALVSVRRSFWTSWLYRRWPSTRIPDCIVECASQLRPPNVGEVRKALREEKPAARSCAVPCVEHGVDARREGRVLDRDPPVALDEHEQDVLAAQAGQQPVAGRRRGSGRGRSGARAPRDPPGRCAPPAPRRRPGRRRSRRRPARRRAEAPPRPRPAPPPPAAPSRGGRPRPASRAAAPGPGP